jgi:hypothetical protein
MSELKFHQDEYTIQNPVQTKVRADSFGLSTFLIKKGFVKHIRSAKRLSNLLMVAVVILCIVILAIRAGGNQTIVDDKYYYDPATAAEDEL